MDVLNFVPGFEQTFLCARAEVPGIVVGIGGCCTHCPLAAADTAVCFNLFGFPSSSGTGGGLWKLVLVTSFSPL